MSALRPKWDVLGFLDRVAPAAASVATDCPLEVPMPPRRTTPAYRIRLMRVGE